MHTTHEEADNIIAQQMVARAKESSEGILVLSDDTDIFALLLHHYLEQNVSNKMVMESPVQDRSAIDITATIDRNKTIVPNFLGAHALTGTDTIFNCLLLWQWIRYCIESMKSSEGSPCFCWK